METYDASQIKVLENIPALEQLENGECHRTYTYCFVDILPEQNEIDRIASNLGIKFTYPKEITERPEELEIHANVIIERSRRIKCA